MAQQKAFESDLRDKEIGKLINKTMSSDSWKNDVKRFPPEWQVQVEAAMARALGHGISQGVHLDIYPVFDVLDRLYRRGNAVHMLQSEGKLHLVDSRGEIVITGSTFRDLCVNIVLAGL